MKRDLKTILPLLAVFALAGLLLFINSPPAQKRGPDNVNVILLTIDSIRPDHLGSYGYKKETSPTIDGVADKGVLFHNAFSQSAWTIPGIMSILTSLHPPVHGVEKRGDMLDPAVTTILDCFLNAGYTVPNICFLLTVPEFATIRVGPPEEEYYSAADDDELLRWLDDNHGAKFFAWFHHRGVHLPYKSNEATRGMFLPILPPEEELSSGLRAVLSDAAVVPVGTAEFGRNDRPILEALYDAEVKELDNFVGRLYAKLDEYDILEKTLVVITADHGEELLDHGFVGHASTMRSATLYDEVIHIPLIFGLGSHLPEGREIYEQVQQIDVMPTILDIVGIPLPAGIQGRSLAPMIFSAAEDSGSSMPVFAETVYGGYQATEEMARTRWRCVRAGGWKLIEIEGPTRKSFHLYDLFNDPKEMIDGFGENPEPEDELGAWLAVWKQQNEVRKKAIVAGTATVFSGGDHISCPEFIFPHNGAVLRFDESGGIVRASWTGDPQLAYVVEYDIGKGIHHVTGSFAVFDGTRDFGPYSRELWRALVVRNPWRIRVSPDIQPRCWSDWIEFNFD
jgi:hypothetical protein